MEVVKKKKKQKNKDTEKVRKKERKKYDRSIISHILKVQFDPEFPRSLPRASLSSLSSRISPYHLLLLFAVLLYTCILHVLSASEGAMRWIHSLFYSFPSSASSSSTEDCLKFKWTTWSPGASENAHHRLIARTWLRCVFWHRKAYPDDWSFGPRVKFCSLSQVCELVSIN